MLKNKPIKYFNGMENESEHITKNIRFEKKIAIKINSLIRKFNQDNKVLKMNNDIFLNVIVQEYFERFEDDKAIMDDLKKRALEIEGIS